MRESIFRGFLIFVLSATVVSWCRAADETAEAVLARAQNAYAASTAVTLKAYQRQVWVSLRDSSPGQASFSPPVRYGVLTLRKKNPDDWYVASWNFTRSANAMSDDSAQMPSSGYLLVKSGVSAGKMSSLLSVQGKPAAPAILTDDEFERSLRTRLGDPYGGFPAVVAVLPASPNSTVPFLFAGGPVRLVGVESWKERAVCRLEGAGPMGNQLIVWIDQQNGLVLRTLMYRGFGSIRTTMTETVYLPGLDAKLGAVDFDMQPPAEVFAPLSDEQMGFGSADDLRQYAGNTAGPQAGGPGQPFGPTTSRTTSSSAFSGGAEQQALTTEQMEGIVLIDGDAGVATGFMTQIRGVDFVVTNQHVLGENKKITLKNLHGEVVPVLAIFGAVGSDIAILRIGKGQGALKLAEDVLKSVKIGDKIVVVGNRLGGGVATQTSGQVLGVGPTRIEVNANFEPGNSGSPIFSTTTKEVVGVATYAETRKVAVEDGTSSSQSGSQYSSGTVNRVEKRWFGYRLDGIAKWEAIDLVRWHAQGERIAKFRGISEGLVALIRRDLKTAAGNEKLGPLIADFEARVGQRGGNRTGIADDVKSLFYSVRIMAESGIRDFESGEYYDYYRTCLYWEESVPMQVEYRKAIVDVLKKYEANSGAYAARMRSGAN